MLKEVRKRINYAKRIFIQRNKKLLVDCNNNFKYSKFDNLKSIGIDYSKFNHISIG